VNPEIFKQRLSNLLSNIAGDESLLREFQDTLRYEDDPLRKGKYRREIMRLKESISQHQQEYEELSQKTSVEEQPAEVKAAGTQLRQIGEKLDLILEGQVATNQGLTEMRLALLSSYSQTEQVVIEGIAEQLSQSQLALSQNLLDALEENKLTDSEMKQLLSLLEEHLPLLLAHKTAAEIITDPSLDVKHRLKVAIPIIPFLLDYEGEIELGTGFNIKTAWEQVQAKLGVRKL
jgi:hypothetical protein